MATDAKYGKVSITNIPANEPVFILRAQDELAELAIRYYARLVQATSNNVEMVRTINVVIDMFHEWDVKKIPD